MSNKLYDAIKWMTLIFPALGTLYFTISSIWGLPYGEQVVGTFTALTTFCAALTKISSVKYNGDGTLKIDTSDPDKDTYHFDLDIPLEDLKNKKSIMLNIDPNAVVKED